MFLSDVGSALKRLVNYDLVRPDARYSSSLPESHSSQDIQIYEQASRLCEVGASIALGPNGVQTLRNLGLQDLAAAGYRNTDGSDHICECSTAWT